MLPELIEIIPWEKPVSAAITVPGSKSITNRALILAALAEGEVILKGALWSEDTQVMTTCLQELGFVVQVQMDPQESGNRTISVYGQHGAIPRGGTEANPMELFVGNAGTAARFLAAFLCLGQGCYRLSGIPRMHQRPQGSLFQALRQLGYRIDAEHDRLPAVIHGGGIKPGNTSVTIQESSQFASALLLAGRQGQWKVRVEGENAEESPYVAMTSQLIQTFPFQGGLFYVEPDASSGSYFWAAGHLQDLKSHQAGQIQVAHWPQSGWQIDAQFPRYLPLPPVVSRQHDLGDSIMTAIVLAPLGSTPIQFTHLGRLRVQECERVHALRDELRKCGARVEEQGDVLTVYPSALHGADIETYHDHRMAMCFAILGLQVPGVRIKNPACVKKTFPGFFQKLNQQSPGGLGIHLKDVSTGKMLEGTSLFAE